MNERDLIRDKTGYCGATFTFRNRLLRFLWATVWLLLCRFSPPQTHRYRILFLRLFGAKVSWSAYIYPDVRIWAPWNLYMEDYATLARGVNCYNIAPIRLAEKAVVSQGSHLCTGTHDYRDPDFPLYSRPINIGRRAWICADAFVGPGVTIHDGAILGARGVAFKDIDAWSIYMGNPAVRLRLRPIIEDSAGQTR